MTKTLTSDEVMSVYFEYLSEEALRDGIIPPERTEYFLFTDDNRDIKGIFTKKDYANILQFKNPPSKYLKEYEYIKTGLSLDEAVHTLKLKKIDFGLVINNRGKVLGVLTCSEIFIKLFEKYKYLESQMDSVLSCVNDAVTVINEHDTVEFWNHAAEKLYGIKHQEIIGKKIDQFFSNLVVTKVVKEKIEVRETYHQPRTGTHVLINSMPVKVKGHIAGSVSAEKDITEVIHLHKQLSLASSQVIELEQEINKISSEKDAFSKIYGHNTKFKDILVLAKRVASTQAAVLIRGESGTGKELFAEAIHQESARSDKRFIVINCAAIPASLLESELFGYESGAFTGADKKGKKGTFEYANEGTIFLDEIGEMPIEMQAKLLRVLQNKIIYRVGGNAPIKIDVRIIAATHRNLDKMISEGQFREDLYYRLNVVSFEIPPLRTRKDDIPELAYLFVKEFAGMHGKNIKSIEPELMGLFLTYHWPGNVRELRNVIERLVILTDDDKIRVENLPEHLRIPVFTPSVSNLGAVNLAEVTEQTERKVILKTLEDVNWNKSKAAKKLGVPRSTLYYKLKSLKLI